MTAYRTKRGCSHWSERVFGLTLVSLFMEICVRVGLLAFLIIVGHTVDKMPEIDQHLAYKYSYPTVNPHDQTVPILHLILVTLSIACTLFVATHAILKFSGRKVGIIVDAFHYLLTMTMIYVSMFILIQCLKVWVKRPRPDFLARCYPNGLPSVWERIPNCTRALSNPVINDGVQSFPSGHSATAWSASLFSFLYLREKLHALSHHQPSKVPRCLPFLFGFSLALIASFVSCSRLWDNQHHPEDIVAGSLIGVSITYVSFYLYYPISPQRLGLVENDDDDDLEENKSLLK